MAGVVTSAFLSKLKGLYPARAGSGSVLSNPWYIVAAVALSASNNPSGVPTVFEHMLRTEFPQDAGDSDRRILARKLREALFKSGLISGYPKAINSLVALHKVMPEALQESTVYRDTKQSLSEYERNGQIYWNSIYGDNDIYDMLFKVYPDLAWFSKTIGYGLTYGPMDILSPLETSYTLVASLIAGDTPQQISWHLEGAKRNGATDEEVRAVRSIAIEVGKLCGIEWKNDVPEI